MSYEGIWNYHGPFKWITLVVLLLMSRSMVDCGFKPWSGQTKDFEINISCFSANYTT